MNTCTRLLYFYFKTEYEIDLTLHVFVTNHIWCANRLCQEGHDFLLCAGRCPVKERLGAQVHDNEGQGEVSHEILFANLDSFNPDLVQNPGFSLSETGRWKFCWKNADCFYQCCGSMICWCGSGSADPCLLANGSGSCYFHHWPSRRQQKTGFLKSFSAYYFWSYIYIIFQVKKSHKTVEIMVFLTIYAYWEKDPDVDPVDPDSDSDPQHWYL